MNEVNDIKGSTSSTVSVTEPVVQETLKRPERTVTVIEPVTTRMERELDLIPEKLRVAAYARVSTEQEEQESSYEAQVDYYTRYIANNPNWEFVGIFADKGITGTNTKNREQFKRMVELALSGKIDLILTKSISRFARNTVDTLSIVRKLKKSGVEVIFEKENLHTFDPKCEVMLTIMSSLAQEESRSISENIRWGHRKSMQSGNVHFAYSRFLGYRKGADGRPEIVEEEAETVREIYNLFLEGKTIRHIAQLLTNRGIPTPTGKQTWSVSTVKSILTNEKYKGDALLQKTYTVDYLTKETRRNDGVLPQYLVERSHEAIIAPEIFEQVQELLSKQAPYRSRLRDTSIFSNKLVCGDCGGFYGRKVWHNHANTERYGVWYCNQKYDGEKCASPVLREEQIKQAFSMLLELRGEKRTAFSDRKWRELVEKVTVYDDLRLKFHLSDGMEAEVELNK